MASFEDSRAVLTAWFARVCRKGIDKHRIVELAAADIVEAPEFDNDEEDQCFVPFVPFVPFVLDVPEEGRTIHITNGWSDGDVYEDGENDDSLTVDSLTEDMQTAIASVLDVNGFLSPVSGLECCFGARDSSYNFVHADDVTGADRELFVCLCPQFAVSLQSKLLLKFTAAHYKPLQILLSNPWEVMGEVRCELKGLNNTSTVMTCVLDTEFMKLSVVLYKVMERVLPVGLDRYIASYLDDKDFGNYVCEPSVQIISESNFRMRFALGYKSAHLNVCSTTNKPDSHTDVDAQIEVEITYTTEDSYKRSASFCQRVTVGETVPCPDEWYEDSDNGYESYDDYGGYGSG